MPTRRRTAGALTVLLVLVALTLIPFLSLGLTAVRPSGTAPGGNGLPERLHWENFVAAFQATNFITLAGSSAVIVAGVLPAALACSAAAGFALAQLRVPGARILFGLFILGLVVPIESAVVPLYYQAQELGTLNTQWAVILPLIGLAMPFGVFWMRGHFGAVPAELTEAARMDGATSWQTFRHIHLPLATPALVTLGLLQFLSTWNHFMLAVVLIDDPSKRTMAGALAAFQGQYSSDIALLSAAALLLMLPTLLVFVLLQRHFVKALLAGAVKG